MLKPFGLFLLLAGSCSSMSSSLEDLHPTPQRASEEARPSKGSPENACFWKQKGQEELDAAKDYYSHLNTNRAKNIIIFVGDGMSLPTLTTSRIYKAQYEARLQNKTVNGEETLLTFETFPNAALSKTYSVDRQTPDSASTATALFTGVKTNFFTLGFDNTVVFMDPKSDLEATKVDSVMKWAQDAGKDTGFVTTARVSHATPAGLYAHSSSRLWECDRKLPPDSPDGVVDITYQLVMRDPGRRAKVVLGGGINSFLPYNSSDPGSWDCKRGDGLNLIDEFLKKNASVPGFENSTGAFLANRDDLMNFDVSSADYVLGLFSESLMAFEDSRAKTKEPSIIKMTEKAIEFLKKGEDGFFLMVEGSNVDISHHLSQANRALHETMMLDKAVEAALKMVNLDDTLIIVTADHSHTMNMAGYQSRGSDVRGLVDGIPNLLSPLAADDKPYTILSYGNGAGFNKHLSAEGDKVQRLNLTDEEELKKFGFQFPAPVPLRAETHSGTDVGIFAAGPFAHLFHGVHEQTHVANVMAYSGCLGPYKHDCPSKSSFHGPFLSVTLLGLIAYYMAF